MKPYNHTVTDCPRCGKQIKWKKLTVNAHLEVCGDIRVNAQLLVDLYIDGCPFTELSTWLWGNHNRSFRIIETLEELGLLADNGITVEVGKGQRPKGELAKSLHTLTPKKPIFYDIRDLETYKAQSESRNRHDGKYAHAVYCKRCGIITHEYSKLPKSWPVDSYRVGDYCAFCAYACEMQTGELSQVMEI